MSAEILQAIATALVTILGCFMFYDSKKRTEAAKASQEEAKATAQYASGWKDLCERKDSELKAKGSNRTFMELKFAYSSVLDCLLPVLIVPLWN